MDISSTGTCINVLCAHTLSFGFDLSDPCIYNQRMSQSLFTTASVIDMPLGIARNHISL